VLVSYRRLRGAFFGICTLSLAAALCAGSAFSAPSAASPFKVMVITGINTNFNNNPGTPVAVAAAQAYINAHGGIGGRPLDVTVCNQQDSADIAAACARQAIDGNYDDVISASAYSTNTTPLLTAAQVPMIGSVAGNNVDFKSKFVFPLQPGVAAVVAGVPWYMITRLKMKRIASITTAVAQTAVNQQVIGAMIRAARGVNLGTTWTPLQVPDFAPWAAKIADQKPDGIFCGLATSQMLPFIAARAQFGMKAPCGNAVTAGIPPSVIANFPDGTILTSPLPFPGTTKALGDRLYLSQMAGQTPDKIYTNGTQYIWTTLYGLQALAKRVQGPVTRASMLKAARAATNKKPIDVLGVVKWTPGARGPAAYPNLPASTVFVYEVRDGKPVYRAKVDVWKFIGIAR
jgi:ABC-type branched-subunit amino acid transport system substrate-binding protein